MMDEQSERLAATVSYFEVNGRVGKMTPPALTARVVRAEMNGSEYEARDGT
jgi:hypothetical protein